MKMFIRVFKTLSAIAILFALYFVIGDFLISICKVLGIVFCVFGLVFVISAISCCVISCFDNGDARFWRYKK